MKSYVIIGAGQFGGAIARELAELGREVMVIDKDEGRVQAMTKYVTHAVTADATDEAVLHSLGVRNFDVAVVSVAQDMGASVLITLLLHNMGIANIVAKAADYNHGKILEKVGADRVVFPEKEMGVRVAQSLARTNLLDYIELSPEYSIAELRVPHRWVGKSIRELNVRAKYRVNIVGIKHGEEITLSPGPEYVFRAEDSPIVIGGDDDVNAL